MNHLSRLVLSWILIGGLILTVPLVPTQAESLSEGFVLTQKNLDENLGNTFQGHTIESLLTDAYEMRIRQQGLRMRLKTTEELKLADAWKRKTDRYRGEPTYDAQAQRVQNYRAGLPFPQLDAEDPKAGAKAYFNLLAGPPTPPLISHQQFYNTFIDGENGIERLAVNTSTQYGSYNNYRQPPGEEVHNSDRHSRGLQFILRPQNLKGIGTYGISFMKKQIPRSWAYLRSLRRVRRTPADNWMTRVATLGDFYGDAFGWWSAMYPSFYEGFEYQGKKWVLVPQVVKGEKTPVNPEAPTSERRYPYLDLTNSPYWNFDTDYYAYEPRLAHVVKQNPPEEHTLGSRTIYIDAKLWRLLGHEEYDKNGKLAQQIEAAYRNRGVAGRLGPLLVTIACYNFKAMHATSLTNLKSYVSIPRVDRSDVSLTKLRRAEMVAAPE